MNHSQKQQILASLKLGHSLTPVEALRLFGCFRLAARILELRQEGWNIISHTGCGGYAEYRLLGSKEARRA